MNRQVNWISLALKIIEKQDGKTPQHTKTKRYIQSYIDTLLDKGKLTAKQSEGLIRNIDIHLGISLPSQIVQISRKTAWVWKKRLNVPSPAEAPQAYSLDEHWRALLAHYGDWEAVAHAACDRLEGPAKDKAPASIPTAPKAQASAHKPIDRNQQVTVSIWERSGNLDYRDGSRERIVFHDPIAAKQKLEKAGAPESLWRSLALAWEGLDDRWDVQLGTLHDAGDPKGKKAPTNSNAILLKAVAKSDKAKTFVTLVQSSYPQTAVAGLDGWTKKKSGHPDLKGWFDGFGKAQH